MMLRFTLCVLMAGCATEQSEPARGILDLAVSGLPPAQEAAIVVTGPRNFTRELLGSTTLNDLAPGRYTIAVAKVTARGTTYLPVIGSQTVEVRASRSPAAATVRYGTGRGTLSITVAGLPPSTDAAITVTGPSEFRVLVTGPATLSALAGGSYTITAATVGVGKQMLIPSPPSQEVDVTADDTALAVVTYNAPSAQGS